MTELTAETVHRKGRHRLYVSRRSDRTSIGYWDLAANEPHPNHPGDLDLLVGRVRQWMAEHPDEAAWWKRPERASAPPEESWTDFAVSPPEPVVRASEERAESPVRALWERVRGTHREERDWGTGAEEKVGSLLQKVAAKDIRWRPPIHALPGGNGGSDIDHVLIGTGGVFTVTVKHHPRGDVEVERDQVRVNGYDWHYVDKARDAGARAAKLLTATCGFVVDVEALIVIVGAKHLRVGLPADRVHLLEAGGLARWLRWRPDVYSDGIVDAMYDTVRRSAVWQPPMAG